MTQSARWHEPVHGCASFPSSTSPIFNTRKKFVVMKVVKASTVSSDSNAKKANLCAEKKERIKLPHYDKGSGNGGKTFHISEFLSHPSGTEAMLNTRALKSFEPLDTHTYRCTLPKLQLLNFEAAPVMDLKVTPTDEDCVVEMLSCRFEGSEAVERQNSHFSAFMVNHMSWDTSNAESFLEVDVKLKLTLEIYTRPFTMMPVSAIERPGNLMMQALVDRLVPLLLQQLLQDYSKWVDKQLDDLPSKCSISA